VFNVREADAINDPIAIFSLKCKVLDRHIGWGIWDLAEVPRHVSIVGAISDRVADYKSHDHIGGCVVDILAYSTSIAHGEVFAGVVRKVDDDFIALAHGQEEIFGIHRMRQKTLTG
jgi:hypothetical protein